MLIGDSARFGVEYELDENYGGVWLYGRLCYWANGQRVGSFDLGTSLRDVLFQMTNLIGDCGRRNGGALCHDEPNRIFRALDKALYDSATDDGNVDDYLDTPARFDVRIPVDVFDGWKIFLLECGGNSLLLFKDESGDAVHTCALAEGEFDNVIQSFHSELETLYERESPGTA